ncbi:hypothetical protein HII31_13760 [Pseudocercospora fuligena]|uniref:Uncharacterized protein n=1 Tax=Pseudocercospora fuligena TaxID=685502 RepID=A0A8H6VE71_9PEZI|nr:hypothetical protein HII31_13760 [Pseudocercospora fuligena]
MRSPDPITPRKRHAPERLVDVIQQNVRSTFVLPLPEDEHPSSPSDSHHRIASGTDPIETDFGVTTILARRTEQELDSYLVKWQPTDVRADQVHEENGDTVVEIDGVRYGEVEEIWGLEDHANEADTVTVVWRESWRTVWRLGRALGCVAEYYKKHPDQDEVRNLQPRFWNWYQLDPEKLRIQIEAMSWAEVELNGTDFQPEDIDYTKPLMKLCNRLLKQKLYPWVRLLNMPVMRLLRFTDQWIERGHFHIERVSNLRAMLVHCVGTRKVDRCTACADPELGVPFEGCVVDDAEFRGACTNCVVLGGGREQRCEWHHGIRSCERNESRLAEDVVKSREDIEGLSNDDSTEEFQTGESQLTPPSDHEMAGGLGDASSDNELAAGEPSKTSFANDSGEIPDSRPATPCMTEDDELYKLTPDLPTAGRCVAVSQKDTMEMHRPHSAIAHQASLAKESNGLFVTPDRDSECPKAETSRRASRSESILAFRPASHSKLEAKSTGQSVSPVQPKPTYGEGSIGWPQKKRRDEPLVNASTPQPKRQRPSLEPSTPRVGKHKECGRSFTCLDVEVGYPDVLGGPIFIYSDHSFDHSGQATPAEVRYILARCSCVNAEKLRRAYRDYIAHRRERGMNVDGLSFEAVMSEKFWEALNEAIRLGCPTRPGFGFKGGETIVLDD